MKPRTLYDNSKYLLFYSAEGGILSEDGVPEIPNSQQIGNSFIDDFFTLGDTPETIHRKIKFRVRIKVDRTSDDIIILDKVGEIKSKLHNYSNNQDEIYQ